jgi:S-formylglutathione hydrolase FrmB
MLTDELPGWLSERGFGAIQAGWGWSMGGFGVLSYAAAHPGALRGIAAFSPAVYPADPLLAQLAQPGAPGKTQLGVWCGAEDALLPNVRQLVSRMATPPRIVSFTPGAHTRAFWDEHTVEAFRFLSAAMTGS